jgi:polyhydroxyalkanoate synthase
MKTNKSKLADMASTGAPHRICYLSGKEIKPNALDMSVHSAIADLTRGISPVSVLQAWSDWAIHFAISPGKQTELLKTLQTQVTDWLTLEQDLLHKRVPENTEANDRKDTRFSDQSWGNWPFNAISRVFLQQQQLLNQATSGVRGVSTHHEKVVNFMARQFLDVLSPSNYPWLNPEVLTATVQSGGKNFVAGAENFLHDLSLRQKRHLDGDHTRSDKAISYQPGREVAVSPGKVVFKNDLIELIQYAPKTEQVFAEPVLIVPSWIMKFYILDLSPHNSMVRFLVEQGHTVFMISWKNPNQNDRDLGMHDYIDSGLFAALVEVARIVGSRPVHTVGYCLGGTLLSIGVAALAAQTSSELGHATPAIKSVTLLAAQVDFNEPGELGLFIDEAQLAMLDAKMWEQGFLDGEQMAQSFQLLNSRDLIWSKVMREYLLGVRNSPNDLMSWNADTTRLPYRMHSEYLRHLFLHDDLAEGRYEVNGMTISLRDIQSPMFVIGTAHDHVSPWRSVFKIRSLTDAPVDFVLSSGGHNAGIVSEPGHANRHYQYLPVTKDNKYIGADQWLRESTTEMGSWWVHWQKWLAQHSSAKKISAVIPNADLVLGDAPGTYVLEK